MSWWNWNWNAVPAENTAETEEWDEETEQAEGETE
jgi:hypothetical protein